MESPASRRKDMCGILACRARIPLEHREAVLMMLKVTVCIVEGTMSRWVWVAQNVPWRRGCGERSETSTGLGTDGKVGSRKGGTRSPVVAGASDKVLLTHLGGTGLRLLCDGWLSGIGCVCRR